MTWTSAVNYRYDEACSFSHKLLIQFTLLVTLTSIGAFVLGNLLLTDSSTFITSLQSLIAALSIILSIYVFARITSSLAWGITIIFSSLCLSVVLDLEHIRWLIYGLGLYGMISLFEFANQHRDVMSKQLFWGALFGSFITISAKVVTSFDMIDRLYTGTAHRDTLFHASLASMIKHYDTVSTGLNGLVETPYHILSHVLFAAFSNIAATSILETYGTAQFLIMIPVLMATVAYTSALYCDKTHIYKYFMITGFVLAIAPRLLNSFGLKEGYFGSESYTLGLILLLISLPALLRKRPDLYDRALLIIAIPLMTLAKSSVGVIFIGLLAVKIILFTRSRRDLILESLILLTIATIVVIILLPMFDARLINQPVEYWQYIKCCSAFGKYASDSVYALTASILIFIAVHFIFSWLTIKSRVKLAGQPVHEIIFHDRVAAYSFAAIVGGMLAVIMPIAYGSSGYYFSNIAMFVSLPWFVAIASDYEIPVVKNPYIAGLILILLFKSTKIIEKSSLERDEIIDQKHASFVDTLLDVRNSSFIENVLYTPKNLTVSDMSNPYKHCESRPHVYPAISERAWLDIINTDQGCIYVYYTGNGSENDENKSTDQLKRLVPTDTDIVKVDFSHRTRELR